MFRCVDAKAYEVKRDDVSNGIFINFLKQRVCENEKVTVMLDRVGEGRAQTRGATKDRNSLITSSSLFQISFVAVMSDEQLFYVIHTCCS